MITFLTLVIVLWFGLGYVTAAKAFAHFQREFSIIARQSKGSDKFNSLMLFIFGVPGFIGYLMFTMCNPRASFTLHGFDWFWPIR